MKQQYISTAFVYLIYTFFLCLLSSFNPHKEVDPVSFTLNYKKNARNNNPNIADKKFILQARQLSFEINHTIKKNQKNNKGQIELNDADLLEIKKLVNRYQLCKDYQHNCIESKKPSFQLNFKLFVATYSVPRTKQFVIQIQGGESLFQNETFNSMEILIEGLEKIIHKKR